MANTVTLQAYLQELNFMLDNDAPTEVVSHCRYILQHFPKNVAVYRLLGQALLQKGQNEVQPQLLEEAAEIFRRVLSAQPDDYVAQIGLGEIAEQRGALDDAIWYFERAAEQTPGNNVLQDTIRQLYEKRGVQRSTEEKLPLTRVTLVRQYLKAGAHDQALSEIRGALADTPDRLDLRMLEAEALWESGRWTEAGEAAAAVLHDCPDCLSANRIMAGMWLKYKRPTDAQPFLARLESLDPLAAARVLKADGEVADVVALPRLDYTSKAAASLTSEMPEWVQDLGETDQYTNPFEAPPIEPPAPSMPAFHEEPPSAGVPDWAAMFAGAEPEPEPAWPQAQDMGAPREDMGSSLPEDLWDAPFPSTPSSPASPSAPAPLADVPDWFAEAIHEQAAPEEPFGAAQWPGPDTLRADDYSEAQWDAGSEQAPEFDSFFENLSAARSEPGEFGGVMESDLFSSGGSSDTSEDPFGSAPAGDSGYALDWMNDLGAPAAEPAPAPEPEPDFTTPDLPSWDSLAEPAAPAPADDWLANYSAETEEEPEAEPEPDLSENDWLSVLETRATAGTEHDVVPAETPEEDDSLSEEDWITRLSTGPLDSQSLPESTQDQLDLLGDLNFAADEEISSSAVEPELPEPETSAKPMITEEELAMLRRASMPPPELDPNAPFVPEDVEAVPAEEIPSWMQPLEPEEPAAETPMQSPEGEAWGQIDAASFAEMLDTEAAQLSDEEIQSAFMPMEQPGDASDMFNWLGNNSTEESDEAASDLMGVLDLPPASLPGTVELDAELLAFFETPAEPETPAGLSLPGTDVLPESSEFGHAFEESTAAESSDEPERDWLSSYAAPEMPLEEEAEASAFAESVPAEWMPQDLDLGPLTNDIESEPEQPQAEVAPVWSDEIEALTADTPPIDEAEETELAGVTGLETDESQDQPVALDVEEIREVSGDAETPGWLSAMQPSTAESPLLAELDTLLNQPYDPFESGREDQVPSYATAGETGILQPNEQPDWMTAFLDGEADEEAEPAEASDALAAPDKPASRAAVQGEGVLAPDAEEDWLASLETDDEVEPDTDIVDGIPAVASQPSEEPAPAESESEESTESGGLGGVYVPLQSRQPKLNYMPDWLAAIASEGKKFDAELNAAEQPDADEFEPALENAPASAPEPQADDWYAVAEETAWQVEDVAELPQDASESVQPAASLDVEDLMEEAHEPAPEVAPGDDTSAASFLEQLDQVDWLPEVREETDGDEAVPEEDFLADLDLGDLSDTIYSAQSSAPEPEVAPAWDLPDTTNDSPAQQDDFAPTDNFAFDDEELPAWFRGEHGRDQGLGPDSGLPEWLRSPDED
jgi:tetratricopeptide (TPR) repeat protein